MAALDFPASPSVNDIYSSGGRSWQWDGTSWNSVTPTSLTNVTGTLAVANGGTGAVDATNARSNLGLAIGTNVQAFDAGLASIAGLTTSADQGIYTTASDTYATFSLTSAGRALLDDADASAQRTTLGLGTIATQAASSVSITGGSITGITDLAVADGGTGASDAATARTNLGLAIGTNVQAFDAGLASIAGLTTSADQGIYTTASDTYATFSLTSAGRALLDDADASAQRTTLGLGTIATQAASSVSITGGSITGITDLAVADGGTGASDAATARTNLGLAIGTNVQAYDAGLASIAGLTTSADQGIYTTASDTYATFSLTSAGRALLDDADASAQRTTLGLGTIATQAASSVSITGGSITGITDLAVADGGTGASSASAARVNLLPAYAGNGSKVLALNSGATDTEWVTPSGGSAPDGGFGFRNRIINGDMRIDQRNEGTALTVNAATVFRSVDRWTGYGAASEGVFTLQRSTSTPPAGFTNFLRATTSTASASPASGSLYFIRQLVEGLNCQDLQFGAAGAQTVTISFWVRSSLTGTFSGSVGNGAANRSYPFTYSISSANTWEYKTVAIAGDTTGTWLVTNGVGLALIFDLGSGSTFLGTAGSWAAANLFGASSSTRVISTLSATLDLTGVQLEVGNAATEFERRPFGQELELCFRYFRRYASDASNHCLLPGYGLANSTTGGYGPVQLSPIMRDNPTLSVSAAADLSVDTSGTAAAMSAVSIYGGYTTKNSVLINFTVASGLVNGQAYMFRVNSGTGKHASFSAEL